MKSEILSLTNKLKYSRIDIDNIVSCVPYKYINDIFKYPIYIIYLFSEKTNNWLYSGN